MWRHKTLRTPARRQRARRRWGLHRTPGASPKCRSWVAVTPPVVPASPQVEQRAQRSAVRSKGSWQTPYQEGFRFRRRGMVLELARVERLERGGRGSVLVHGPKSSRCCLPAGKAARAHWCAMTTLISGRQHTRILESTPRSAKWVRVPMVNPSIRGRECAGCNLL